MQRSAGGVDLEQQFEQLGDRRRLGQPHGHDLVIPEAEPAQAPGAEGRRRDQGQQQRRAADQDPEARPGGLLDTHGFRPPFA